MTTPDAPGLPELLRRAIPFLRDEAANYVDDGSNEPLELARAIEAALAGNPNRDAANPGGCECEKCGRVFIGAEWHVLCGICVDHGVAQPDGSGLRNGDNVSASTPEASPQPQVTNPAYTACNVEGTWLWGKLMDWCRAHRTSPASFDSLFATAREAHQANQQAGQNRLINNDLDGKSTSEQAALSQTEVVEVVAYLIDGRVEQGLAFDKQAAEDMAFANAGTVVPLARADAISLPAGLPKGWHVERVTGDADLYVLTTPTGLEWIVEPHERLHVLLTALLAAAPAASGGEVAFRSCTCHTENEKRLCMNKRECVVATAQTAPEPLAQGAVVEITGWKDNATPRLRFNTKIANLPAGTKLYASPQPAAEDLTDELSRLRRVEDKYRAILDSASAPNPPQPSASVVVPHQECYSENFDTWFDSPDDSAFVDGLKVGDTYKLQVSHYSIEREYVVTKVPDETNDDYEVRPVIESALTTAAGGGE